MSEHSQIEWTDATWNPVRGCTKITPGLRPLLRRDVRRALPRRAGPPLRAGLRPPPRPREARRAAALEDAEDDLRQLDERPLPQGRARRLRRGGLPDDGAGELAHLSGADQALRHGCGTCSQTRLQFAADLPHIWWGVSVEDRAHGLPRIEHLRQAPAAVRFLSIEPLLEDLGVVNLEGIHWVIVGGESGPGPGPCTRNGSCRSATSASRRGCPLLLQAMGRRPQEQGRARAGRQDVRRGAGPRGGAGAGDSPAPRRDRRDRGEHDSLTARRAAEW